MSYIYFISIKWRIKPRFYKESCLGSGGTGGQGVPQDRTTMQRPCGGNRGGDAWNEDVLAAEFKGGGLGVSPH